MSKKDTLIKGTFILTITGFLSRFIGFFYRIFLSRTFGEEGMGLYQLVFPVFSLGFSLSVAGIEVALSRLTAQKLSLKKNAEAKQCLFTALLISLTISTMLMLLIQKYSFEIAEYVLLDGRCQDLLIALSYIFPFCAVHSCICGYYLGQKKTKRIAISQLIEQIVRVLSVYIICSLLLKQNRNIPVSVTVLGLVIGETASAFYCFVTFQKSEMNFQPTCKSTIYIWGRSKELLTLSIPLTANRVLLNVLQSIETISIPACLVLSGLTESEALSLYGVLTGMAMPCIFFPSALAGSIATMLLPTIAEMQAQQEARNVQQLIKKVASCVFFFGCLCTAMFFLFGNFIGVFLFHSHAVGSFIMILAWICPFMYVNTTLISMLNGLGKTTVSFSINTCGVCLRIGSVFFLIPKFGILGYLWGLLASQILISILAVLQLHRIHKQFH